MTEGRREPPSEPASQRPDQPERYGPLRVERHRKADGRALILYRADAGAEESRAGEDDAAEGDPDVDAHG